MNQSQLDWYNAGVTLLMAVMNGRGVDRDSAERKVYEQWRNEGSLIETIKEELT